MKIKQPRVFGSLALLLAALLLGIVGCGTSSQDQDAKKTGEIATRYGLTQPIPDPDWSAIREAQIQIEWAMINTSTTYQFSVDSFGHPIFACRARSYPIPFGMQLTSPEGIQWVNGTVGYERLPLMEPYGLFPPSDVRASWMTCELASGNMAPVYSEPDVIAPPSRSNGWMKAVDAVIWNRLTKTK